MNRQEKLLFSNTKKIMTSVNLTKKNFFIVCALVFFSCTPNNSAPTFPVLFENGQWAAELGNIITHTPSAGRDCAPYTWTLKDGMIHITNTIPDTRNIPFRWVFENTIDIRGYDAVVMVLEDAPIGFFRPVLRFRTDVDAAFDSENHTNIIRMARETYNVIPPNVGFNIDHMDFEKFDGVGALPDFGQSVRIKKIYLEGDGIISTLETINSRNIMDILPPRTGNTPVTEIITSQHYTGTIEWYPNHDTFQADVEYTATITLTPRYGWTFDGVPANWFRVFDKFGSHEDNTLTHAAGANVLTRIFPATIPVMEYPEPTQFVALSFDDTLSSDTNDLLDILKKLGIRATFFSTGINLEKARTNPELQRALDRIIAEGHEIAHHAWQHDRWNNEANVDVMRADFKRNYELIREITGKAPQWVRFPTGAGMNPVGSNALTISGELGMTHLWGVDMADWDKNNSASFVLNRMLTQTGNNGIRDGQIYLGHDMPGQTNTMQALPEFAHELRSRGICFMTATELREHKNFSVMPGVNYHNFVHDDVAKHNFN
jgi:peptidoglycan/xylan/chitin deacetylase (PgdA/CDA1 family)